jgi:hypothetical protein
MWLARWTFLGRDSINPPYMHSVNNPLTVLEEERELKEGIEHITPANRAFIRHCVL